MSENKLRLYQLESGNANNGQALVWDSSTLSWLPGTAMGGDSALPTQSNNGGKFLTTDGNTLSWVTTVTSVTVESTDLLVGNATVTTSGNISVNLATTGVIAGTYKSVTVDAKGRVTAGTNPTTLADYGITDGLTLSGTQTTTNKTLTAPNINGAKVKGEQAATIDLGTLSTGTSNIDLSSAQIFAATIESSAAVTFNFLNPPAASHSQMVMLQVTNGGSGTVEWPAGTKFSNGVAPVLVNSGVDLLGVFYNSLMSSYVVFLLGRDIK